MYVVKVILLFLFVIVVVGMDVIVELSASSMSYAKMIVREMGKVEVFVKIIFFLNDGLVEMFKVFFFMIVNVMDFKVICLFKGMKLNEIFEFSFGFFVSVGVFVSFKLFEDLFNVLNRFKVLCMDNVIVKMFGMFK